MGTVFWENHDHDAFFYSYSLRFDYRCGIMQESADVRVLRDTAESILSNGCIFACVRLYLLYLCHFF
jgi:hypothetical protein